MSELLQKLACSDLTPEEIVGASMGRNTLLIVAQDSGAKEYVLSCGANPFYTATLDN